jgi:hypothetical protein
VEGRHSDEIRVSRIGAQRSHILLCMQDIPESPPGHLRWQYLILWRYGGLCLVLVGLAMMGIGASGIQGVPISMALLSLGFVSLIAGVVLPRIEGKFSAGRGGVAGELMAVHKMDTLVFTASAPALAVAVSDAHIPVDGQTTDRITLGDVWDALEQAGFRVTQAATGKRLLEGPYGRSIMLHGQELLGFRVASDDLLTQLVSWGITPIASGKYKPGPGVDPAYAMTPYSGVPLGPRD